MQSRAMKLFTNFAIHTTAGVKPISSEMEIIVKCAGGEYLKSLPKSLDKVKGKRLLIVSCSDDLKNESILSSLKSLGAPVFKEEVLLNSILNQQFHCDLNKDVLITFDKGISKSSFLFLFPLIYHCTEGIEEDAHDVAKVGGKRSKEVDRAVDGKAHGEWKLIHFVKVNYYY